MLPAGLTVTELPSVGGVLSAGPVMPVAAEPKAVSTGDPAPFLALTLNEYVVEAARPETVLVVQLDFASHATLVVGVPPAAGT
jgi:hypothetical protein